MSDKACCEHPKSAHIEGPYGLGNARATICLGCHMAFTGAAVHPYRAADPPNVNEPMHYAIHGVEESGQPIDFCVYPADLAAVLVDHPEYTARVAVAGHRCGAADAVLVDSGITPDSFGGTDYPVITRDPYHPGITFAGPPKPSEPERCDVCSWPLSSNGCKPGDCSYRPDPGSVEWRRIRNRQEILAAKVAAPPTLSPAEVADALAGGFVGRTDAFLDDILRAAVAHLRRLGPEVLHWTGVASDYAHKVSDLTAERDALAAKLKEKITANTEACFDKWIALQNERDRLAAQVSSLTEVVAELRSGGHWQAVAAREESGKRIDELAVENRELKAKVVELTASREHDRVFSSAVIQQRNRKVAELEDALRTDRQSIERIATKEAIIRMSREIWKEEAIEQEALRKDLTAKLETSETARRLVDEANRALEQRCRHFQYVVIADLRKRLAEETARADRLGASRELLLAKLMAVQP